MDKRLFILWKQDWRQGIEAKARVKPAANQMILCQIWNDWGAAAGRLSKYFSSVWRRYGYYTAPNIESWVSNMFDGKRADRETSLTGRGVLLQCLHGLFSQDFTHLSNFSTTYPALRGAGAYLSYLRAKTRGKHRTSRQFSAWPQDSNHFLFLYMSFILFFTTPASTASWQRWSSAIFVSPPSHDDKAMRSLRSGARSGATWFVLLKDYTIKKKLYVCGLPCFQNFKIFN